MDEPNLVPMFNSYAWGASLSQDDRNEIDKLNPEPLPFEREHPFRKSFSQAGLIVDRGQDHYSIINFKKGGVTYHFVGNKLKTLDCGTVIESPSGILGSNHFYDMKQSVSIQNNRIIIRHRISEMPKSLLFPLNFLFSEFCV